MCFILFRLVVVLKGELNFQVTQTRCALKNTKKKPEFRLFLVFVGVYLIAELEWGMKYGLEYGIAVGLSSGSYLASLTKPDSHMKSESWTF